MRIHTFACQILQIYYLFELIGVAIIFVTFNIAVNHELTTGLVKPKFFF